MSLAGSPDGHAVLATDRHVTATSVVVAAARRLPGAAFGPLADVSPAQFVSDAYGATAATLPQPTAGAITPSAALAAWVGPQGGQVARAGAR